MYRTNGGSYKFKLNVCVFRCCCCSSSSASSSFGVLHCSEGAQQPNGTEKRTVRERYSNSWINTQKCPLFRHVKTKIHWEYDASISYGVCCNAFEMATSRCNNKTCRAGEWESKRANRERGREQIEKNIWLCFSSAPTHLRRHGCRWREWKKKPSDDLIKLLFKSIRIYPPASLPFSNFLMPFLYFSLQFEADVGCVIFLL